MLRSLFFYLTFYPWTLIVLLLAPLISLFGENAVHSWGSLWGRSALILAGLRSSVSGSQYIPQGPAIYVANHQSNFDIPLLYASLPIQFRWLAKKELFDIPLLGLGMKRCGYIPIDRSNPRKALRSMQDAAHQVRAGVSVVVFPEGTRSPDGELQEFKKGALLIALKAGVPVVPVAIRGSYAVMAKDSLQIHGGAIDVEIFTPIATAGMKNSDMDDLLKQVREPIAAMLKG